MKRVITFGTFDLLHQGHLRILERARSLGCHLTVGVSTDRLNAEKGKRAFFSQGHRAECVKALKCVDEVFFEDSLEDKDKYIRAHAADVLVMGDDWSGQFDWVSCEVIYLPRTEGVSSTEVKINLGEHFKPRQVIFADTYIKKHYDCALSLVDEMTYAGISPILTQTKELPEGIRCDALVYFNYPESLPDSRFDSVPKILIDHGASHLKWFLSNAERFAFFDEILTAGPDHVKSLLTFFSSTICQGKVRSTGFVKSKQLLAPPVLSRELFAAKHGLDSSRPIVLFAPTWHISNNRDMADAIEEISGLENCISVMHPETAHLETHSLNVLENRAGVLSEALKHCDVLISDLSSTIFEAAALRKPTVQVLLREYSDNNSVLFDYPYTAGTAELFVGGLCARPGSIVEAVQRVLDMDDATRIGMERIRERVLSGTRIEEDATNVIVKEIFQAIVQPRSEAKLDREIKVENALAHDNLRFARARVIAHGGGDYKGHHASNSREAVLAARSAVDLIELDFVLGKDGVLVAHDGFEARYGISHSFATVSSDAFSSCKFNNELSALSVPDAVGLCATPGQGLVCDIKPFGADYDAVAEEIARVAGNMGVLANVVLQCYEVRDVETALRLGIQRILLPVWKTHYRDPLGVDAVRFIEESLALDSESIIGITVPYWNKHMACPAVDDARMLSLMATWKRIFIHGAPKDKYSSILNSGFGVFADGICHGFDFADYPVDFEWSDYLFLNPDVIAAGHFNRLAAATHFLRYGKSEGRLTRFSSPSDFVYSEYVDINPQLRRAGISGPDTAKAHWTRYGQREGMQYSRKELS